MVALSGDGFGRLLNARAVLGDLGTRTRMVVQRPKETLACDLSSQFPRCLSLSVDQFWIEMASRPQRFESLSIESL
jgi:hypothetical protein